MKQKYIRVLYTYIVGVVFMLCAVQQCFSQVKFIPNLGQWQDPSRFRADVKSGRIFMCENEIRYNFIDSRDIETLHRDPFIEQYSYNGHALLLKWLNANPNPKITSQNEYPEYYNFYLTHTEEGWRSGVKAYSDLTYSNLYPNINMQVTGIGSNLKYTYTVLPGTDASVIKIAVTGAEGVFVQEGDLHINTTLVNITEKSPYAYQLIGDVKVPVACNFVVGKGDIISFVFPNGYDKSKPLVIDPVVVFATYSGATQDNFGFTGTFDNQGNGYSGGDIFGAGFPYAIGSFQATFGKGVNWDTVVARKTYIQHTSELDVLGFTERDAAILKYTPDGKNLIFETYLGGSFGNEQPHSMVVDKAGNLIVFGTTNSGDFPVTKFAYDTSYNGKTDIFISKISPDGKKMIASTFVGGSDYDGLNGLDGWNTNGGFLNITGQGKLGYNYGDQFRGEVIVDKAGNICVATTTLSSNFPTTTGSMQPKFGGGTQDGCVFKLDSSLQGLLWSSYLGGSKEDAAYSLQADSNNNLFVVGATLSPYFFNDNNTYQKALNGGIDGYLCHIKSDGSGIIDATYIGTSKYDEVFFVQLDASENVYVYGQTESTSYPVTNVKYYNPNSCNFITKFNNSLDAIIYSTVFGSGKGAPDVSPTAFLVDKCEKVYISGWGGNLFDDFAPGFNKLGKLYGMVITPDAFQKQSKDSADFYVAVYQKDFDTILYSSYFGGPLSEEHVDGGTSRFDKNGIMYQSVCGGCGGNSDFPVTPGAWSKTNNSDNCNNLLFKVNLNIPTLKAGFIAPSIGCRNVTLHFSNTSSKAKSYLWDFGDGTTSTADTPKHFYVIPGNYTITLVAFNPTSCEVVDTFKTQISVYKIATASFVTQKDTCGLVVNFTQTGTSTTSSWDYGDGTHSSVYSGKHAYAKPGVYIVKLLVDSGTDCADSVTLKVNLRGLRADFTHTFDVCTPTVLKFTNLSVGALKSRKWYFPFASTDTTNNPIVNFSTPGTYTVSLSVTDSFGCKDSTTKIITVVSTPKAGFSFLVDSCKFTVHLANTSTGTQNILWKFSNGDSSRADTLTKTFLQDSIVKITLITEPGAPCADTISRTISFNPPKSDFSYTVDTCTGLVHFVNKSSRGATWLWKFNDKDTSTLKNPTFVYPNVGQYPVKLATITANGCSDTFVKSVIITKDAGGKLMIPNVFTPNQDPFNNKFVITGLSTCYTYRLDIYNRWGQLMHHDEGTKLSWDGYYNGIRVPEGVYYYVFHGTLEGQLKGAIMVLY